MSKALVDKVAVVTGAGRGVGRAYALALAREGASLVINDLGSMTEGGGRDTSAADSVVKEILDGGGNAVANYDDVSDFAAARQIMQTAVTHYGHLDILIANAGIIRPKKLFEATEDDWVKVLGVHANGTFNCYRHAAPLLIERGGGTIVTTGAGVGEGGGRVFPGLGAYRAAKAAILVLTLNAANELSPYDINVNSIMPGPTTTRMHEAFRESLVKDHGKTQDEVKIQWPEAASPDTVPALGVFLCTSGGRRITGRSFSVNGAKITMASSPVGTSTLQSEGAYWTVEELQRTASEWLTR